VISTTVLTFGVLSPSNLKEQLDILDFFWLHYPESAVSVILHASREFCEFSDHF